LFLPTHYYARRADFVEKNSALFFNYDKAIIHKWKAFNEDIGKKFDILFKYYIIFKTTRARLKMPKKEEKQRRLEDRLGPIESIIADKTTFKGKINTHDSVQISGNLKGDVKSEQLVKITEGGKVKGTIESTYVIIEGELIGDIESADYVEIRADARVVGNINSMNIAIAEGSFIQGEVKTPDREGRPISFVEKRGLKERLVGNEE
jgi:cytoskeletal protein CcmA (bactofilin family)